MNRRTRAVVTVAYGAPDLLAAALAPLRGEHVVVVDNSSRADVAAVARAAGAHYVDPGANLGFAAGVNRGLAGLTGDVLLLNPDARLQPADLDRLQATFVEYDDVGAVSPTLVDPAGTVQRTYWPFPTPRSMWAEAFGLARRVRPDPGFVVGAALLLRRETLDEIGGFDERYFLYAEESDWQRRALARGWRAMVAPGVTATHVGAATSTDPRRREALFHAGQELHVRRWSGPAGWASYRTAAAVGAGLRTVVRRDPAAARRVGLYLRGPVAVAAAPRGRTLHVAHVVVTDGAAGTERYVADVATRQAAAGHQVTVVGGGEWFMTAALPAGVGWRPGATPAVAARALRALGGVDVVHAHLTAADLVAVATRPWHGGRVVSTRHTATPRGATPAARAVARVLERGIDVEVCTSAFVRAEVRRPGVVVAPGVTADDRSADPTSRRILIVQRLDPEKATDLAVRAWQASGLAAEGWRLVVHGDGRDRASLQARTVREGIAGVEWAGWSSDVRTEMTRAAALLAPAPREPFGLSVVEAMAVGLPVLATAAGGHRETVGRYGALPSFPPGDRDACAAALREFASWGPERRTAVGEDLRTLQRSAFDVDRHVEALDRLYLEAVAR